MAARNDDLGLQEVVDDSMDMEGVVDDSCCLEPFFYDEAEVLAKAAVLSERRVREAEEKARAEAEYDRRRRKHKSVMKSIRKYEPKLGSSVYIRYFSADFSVFDLNEKSPVRPMRFTNRKYEKEVPMYTSANILSLKIVSSDVGYPINVYGTVIARDMVDYKCVSLFCRRRKDCQYINSEDQSLILTGPTRGLVLLDYIYIEVDLKIKGDHGQKDRELSKGMLMIDGRVAAQRDTIKVESDTLDSKLSTVEVKYADVRQAMEATVKIKVLEGDFHGEITACTTSIKDRIVLHDSKAGGVVTDCNGMIQLQRRVIAVCLKEMLIFTIVTQAGATRIIDFTPFMNGADEAEITCGAVKLLVKVIWSLINNKR